MVILWKFSNIHNIIITFCYLCGEKLGAKKNLFTRNFNDNDKEGGK